MQQRTLKTALGFGLAAGVLLSLLYAQTKAVLPESVAKVIQRNCLDSGCHSGQYPAMNMSLEAAHMLAATLDKPSLVNPAVKIIDSSEPGKSYLLAKLRGDQGIAGKRMPLNKSPLPEADLKLIQDWVQGLKGAKLDPADAAAAGQDQKKNFTSPPSGGRRS